jgi:Bacterial regulatory helix-turn-helix proteins, AraC family
MLQPPLHGLGAGFWFRAKILEISALILVEPTEELFCQRHKRLALERVERVKDALARDLENPPSLSELGREVGCSPFYLSRIFSEHTGLTISRYLRNLRSAPQSCFEADAPMSLRRPWQLATLV